MKGRLSAAAATALCLLAFGCGGGEDSGDQPERREGSPTEAQFEHELGQALGGFLKAAGAAALEPVVVEDPAGATPTEKLKGGDAQIEALERVADAARRLAVRVRTMPAPEDAVEALDDMAQALEEAAERIDEAIADAPISSAAAAGLLQSPEFDAAIERLRPYVPKDLGPGAY